MRTWKAGTIEFKVIAVSVLLILVASTSEKREKATMMKQLEYARAKIEELEK